MRGTPKISVCLVAIGLGLAVFCNSGRPEEAAEVKGGIKELQQKRLAVLEQLCDVANKLFSKGAVLFPEVSATNRELFAARLEYADTQQDRIKACDEAIQRAREFQERAKARQQNARGSYLDVLRAEDFELEAQIARAKVAAGK